MLVSVIIPYNKDRGYLNEAIESVLNQTYKNYELILSHNDASSGFNMNQGIKQAKGDYICYLCDDDLLTPNSLEDRVRCMVHSNYDFIHSRGMHYWSKDNQKPYNLTKENVTFESCLNHNGIMGGSTMYKASMLKAEGWEDYWTSCEWATHLKLLKKGYSLGFLDSVTYLYRRHPEQKSIGNLSSEYQERRNVVKAEIKNRFK